jgi:hypothetical protein
MTLHVGDRIRLRAGVLPKVTGRGREGVVCALWRPRDGRALLPEEYVHAIRCGRCTPLSEGDGGPIIAVVALVPDDGMGASLEAVFSLGEVERVPCPVADGEICHWCHEIAPFHDTHCTRPGPWEGVGH